MGAPDSVVMLTIFIFLRAFAEPWFQSGRHAPPTALTQVKDSAAAMALGAAPGLPKRRWPELNSPDASWPKSMFDQVGVGCGLLIQVKSPGQYWN
jgi:hypothetical protein